VGKDLEAETASSAHAPGELKSSLSLALPNAYLDWRGIPRLTSGRANRRVGSVCTVVHWESGPSTYVNIKHPLLGFGQRFFGGYKCL
jgi:hypothetical protein